jgi:hypothetical protein
MIMKISRLQTVFWGIVLTGTMITLLLSGYKQPRPPLVDEEGTISGYVFANLLMDPEVQVKKQIALMNVQISIQNNGITVASTTTGPDGGYSTPSLKKGTYTLCFAQNGFIQKCITVTMREYSNNPGAVLMDLQDVNNYIYGTVKLRDGKVAFYENPVFGVKFQTNITATSGAIMYNQPCNIFGEYLFTNIPVGSNFTLTATCQQAVATELSAGRRNVDIVFPNSSPRIRAITGLENGQAPIIATPSGILDVKADAEDEDGNPLHYVWVPFGAFPGSFFTDAPDAKWQLPDVKGRYQLFLLVYDDHGGMAYQDFDIISGDKEVNFSGVITNLNTRTTLDGATITANGQPVGRSDAEGAFSFTMPDDGSRRYVLTFHKPGFAMRSLIYFDDATEQEIGLMAATTKTFRPTEDILLTETEDNFTRFSTPIGEQESSRTPAEVFIPGSSIVDERGNPVTDDVDVSIRYVNPYDENGLMPGDFGAISNGEQAYLNSWGAVDVQIRSADDPERKFQLRRGTDARLTIPLFSAIQPNTPGNMNLWDYDEKEGVWREVGTLLNTGNAMVGSTDQFSTLNADIAFTNATCLQILDNPNNPAFPAYRVDVIISVPTGGGAPQVFTYNNLKKTDLPLIVVRLPANTNVTVTVKRKSNIFSPSTTISTQIVNTGNPIPGAASMNPSPPYTFCNDVYLKPPPAPGSPGQSPGQVFLSRVSTPSAGEANKYYEHTGAIGGADYNGDGFINSSDKISFTQWKNKHNFSAGDDYKAVYFNAGDLGFWRAMHQKTTVSGGVAYYVSNFTRDVDAISDLTSPNPNAIATVCMEYSPISGASPVTKFYVFNAAGQLVNNADLDGFGPKFTPGLCILCHGGNEQVYTSIANLQTFYNANPNTIPKFLPFDLQSFVFSNQTNNKRPNMEAPLRNMNQRILTSTNANTAILDFVKKAYGATSTTLSGNFIDNAVVSGWNSAGTTNGLVIKDFYTQVIGPSCRTCHITRTNTNLWFDTPAKFTGSGAIGAACGTNKYMPNAKATYIRFWTSTLPFQPHRLSTFLGAGPTCN